MLERNARIKKDDLPATICTLLGKLDPQIHLTPTGQNLHCLKTLENLCDQGEAPQKDLGHMLRILADNRNTYTLFTIEGQKLIRELQLAMVEEYSQALTPWLVELALLQSMLAETKRSM